MIWDKFIRWIAPQYGSLFYSHRSRMIARRIDNGYYCHFCNRFQLNLNHERIAEAMQYPDCTKI